MPESFVEIYNSFDNNLRIRNDFTNYSKKSCWECSDQHSPLRFSAVCLLLRDFITSGQAAFGHFEHYLILLHLLVITAGLYNSAFIGVSGLHTEVCRHEVYFTYLS